MHIRQLITGGIVVLGCLAGVAVGADDEESPLTVYFGQLRVRGLFTLAENYAETRLADPLLSPNRRIDLVIELSRTLAAHAMSAADDQQADLWRKAGAVLAEERSVTGDSPKQLLLDVYAALIPAARAEQLVWDVEASPFEDPPREALDRTTAEALRKLSQAEQALVEKIRTLESRRQPVTGPTAHELRPLLSLVRLKAGVMLLARARLSPAGSQQRHSDVLDAEERLRKVISAGGAEQQRDAKLELAVGSRLRDDYERALEMLDHLERDPEVKVAPFADAVRRERVRILLQTRQPAAAGDALLQIRAGRDRLPGEFWLLQFQALSALRRVAVEKSAAKMVAEIDQRAQAELKRVDQEVGGPWSRRCRAVWAAAESAERYGQRLAALVTKAQGEYLAGRIDTAITAYTSALELAEEDGKRDVEMDIGYTLTAVLAEAGRWEDVARRCRQLVATHPDHSKSPDVDLLGLYALGRLYDADPTPDRRTEYLRSLSEHLRKFTDSPTVSEAEYLRGRLLESSAEIAEALTSYERVPSDHRFGSAAAAAVGRCLVALLVQQRESGTRDPEFERKAVELITPRLKAPPEQPSAWTDPQAELVYHAVKVYLLIEPARFGEAASWLDRLDQATTKSAEEEPSELRVELQRRAGPLRMVALAGEGRPQDAERLLDTLEQAGATELLTVVEELGQMEIESPLKARNSLAEMQLASAETLHRRRNELTADQQRRLDRALAKSYLATSQPKKASTVYQKMLDAAPKDVELARQIGQIASGREELAFRSLARTCWQRVESSHKQGTAPWLEARSRVIESSLALGNRDEAQKLFKVTKLLYPKFGNEELRQRYAELESQLEEPRTK